ncbi:MAG: DNA recombination protein RmuC [Burkholderiales bacterium]|nr:DNA recombination protein RmuC [Burkholderiales bacterium]
MAVLQGVAIARSGSARLEGRLDALARDSERLERELRDAITAGRREALDAARQGREEQTAALAHFGQGVSAQMKDMAALQGERIQAFSQELAARFVEHEQRLGELRRTVDEKLAAAQADARAGREEIAATLKRFGDTLQASLESNAKRMAEIRETVEARLKELAADNAQKLEKMRETVDEKLHAALETRLAESFRQVSERLELLYKGLGEMQTLAAGVGDLKRVLTNVKTRGVLGEVQLAALLEQLLTPDQYARNVATRPGSNERVEFAIRLPGRDRADSVVWLPIDAKFPLEDYERLLKAQEAADADAAEAAAKALESRIRLEAKTIAEKYVEPPATTDFALLYLPFEGLYAEVLRRAGLFDGLQREHRVVVCGPTTLTAILNSLQMGFRTLAIEQRSSEVWQILGAVKTEFGKFGDVLAKTKKKLDEAARSIGEAETRTRVLGRKLRDVEALPAPAAGALLEEVVESEVGLPPGEAGAAEDD